jgi:hypothetical protein
MMKCRMDVDRIPASIGAYWANQDLATGRTRSPSLCAVGLPAFGLQP